MSRAYSQPQLDGRFIRYPVIRLKYECIDSKWRISNTIFWEFVLYSKQIEMDSFIKDKRSSDTIITRALAIIAFGLPFRRRDLLHRVYSGKASAVVPNDVRRIGIASSLI